MKPAPAVKRAPTRTYPPRRKELPITESLPIVVHRAGTSFKDEDAGVLQWWYGDLYHVTWTDKTTCFAVLRGGWFHEQGTLHLLVPHRRLSRPAVHRFMEKHGIKETR